MASNLAAGYALPGITRVIDQETIDVYAAASGDFNPLHVDPDYARATPFGNTILHGYFTMALAAQVMELWRPEDWRNGGTLEVNFLGPVSPGDRLELSATVDEVVETPKRSAVCRITGRVGDRVVLAGTGICPIPGR